MPKDTSDGRPVAEINIHEFSTTCSPWLEHIMGMKLEHGLGNPPDTSSTHSVKIKCLLKKFEINMVLFLWSFFVNGSFFLGNCAKLITPKNIFSEVTHW